MATRPLVHLAVEGVPEGALIVVSADYDARIHAPFSLRVVARTATLPNVEKLLGARASFTLSSNVSSGRTLRGVVAGVELAWESLVLEIEPTLARLAHTRDHRTFLDEDVIAIAETVLAEHAVAFEPRVTRALRKREQTVQAFESDLEFVSRLLADEGLSWFVDDDDKVHCVDAAFAPIDGDATIPFVEESLLDEGEHVFEARASRSLVVDSVRLRDHDFKRPALDLNASATHGLGTIGRMEMRGGYDEAEEGRAVARRRLEEARAREAVLVAASNSARLAVGRTFLLERASRDEMNRRWLIVEHRFHARDDRAEMVGERPFVVEIVAVHDGAYRPERRDAPSLGGVQTTTITGPQGSEIHTEEHGRAKVLLRWDRRRNADATSSTWVRSLQPQLSGSMLLPRVGWEVLLGFAGPSGDEPLVLGRLDNGSAPPAEGLPAHKVRSALGSRTTPGGGSANVLGVDDTAGREGMDTTASSAYVERSENDKAIEVSGADAHAISADRTTIVGLAHVVDVDATRTTTISGSRDLSVGASHLVNAGSHATLVGAARLMKVGGNSSTAASVVTRLVSAAKVATAVDSHNRHVNGAAVQVVGGTYDEIAGVMSAVTVAAAYSRNAGASENISSKSYTASATILSESFASHSVTAGALLAHSFKGPAKLSVGGSLAIKGSVVFVTADSSLKIKAGGTTISMTPSSIEIDGTLDSSVEVVSSGTDRRQ